MLRAKISKHIFARFDGNLFGFSQTVLSKQELAQINFQITDTKVVLCSLLIINREYLPQTILALAGASRLNQNFSESRHRPCPQHFVLVREIARHRERFTSLSLCSLEIILF